MTATTKRPPGRPPRYPAEGRQDQYRITLTQVQVLRALSLGETVSEGVNAALRKLVPVAPTL